MHSTDGRAPVECTGDEIGEWFWFAFPMMDALKLLRLFYFIARLPA